MTPYRGDIYYVIDNFTSTGSEMRAGRPAVIVSANHLNASSRTVEVVWLTTAPRYESDMHVHIDSAQRPSTAVCEQITSISVERLGNFIAQCTPVEMAAIDKAIVKCLALEGTRGPIQFKVGAASTAPSEVEQKLKEMTIERDMYKSLYDTLIAKMIGR